MNEVDAHVQPKIDEDGWYIPRASSKSRVIYLRMKQGMRARDIAIEVGMEPGSVRVLMYRIRHPESRKQGWKKSTASRTRAAT